MILLLILRGIVAVYPAIPCGKGAPGAGGGEMVPRHEIVVCPLSPVACAFYL